MIAGMEGNSPIYKFMYFGSDVELSTPLVCGVQSLQSGVVYETTFYADVLRIAASPGEFKIVTDNAETPSTSTSTNHFAASENAAFDNSVAAPPTIEPETTTASTFSFATDSNKEGF